MIRRTWTTSFFKLELHRTHHAIELYRSSQVRIDINSRVESSSSGILIPYGSNSKFYPGATAVSLVLRKRF